MKKVLILLFPLIFFFVLLGGFFWWSNSLRAPTNDATTRRLVITKGASAEKIGQELKKAGLIKSTFAFKLYLQYKGLAKSIPTGEFRIPGNLSIPQVLDKILEGPTQVWVTIPEGLRREEIVDKFIPALELTDVQAETFRKEFLSQTTQLEGFLFPDTYLFPREATATLVVQTLKTTFDKKYEGLQNTSGLTTQEVVTLASILERETLSKEERPIVAGVFFNRLRAGWPLQADATIQYAIANDRCRGKTECTWWPRPLTRADLAIVSPYNSYTNPGLPPGPISNPGFTSLKAVVESQKTEYWYYIHDSEGTIHFARTLEEHNANVRKYLE